MSADQIAQTTEPTPAPEPEITPEATGNGRYATAAEAMDAVYSGNYQPTEPGAAAAPQEPTPTPEPEPADEPVRLEPEAPAEEAPVAWDKVTQGLVTSFDELKAVIDERKALKENPLAVLPPSEQKLLQLHRNKQDVFEYLQYQQTDFTKLEPMEVLRWQFDQEHKGTPKQIAEVLWDQEIKSKYPNLEPFGENEHLTEVDKWKLTKQSEAIRQQLISKQQEMAIPEPEPAAATAPTAQPEPDPQALEQYLQQVRQAAAFKSISVDVQVGDQKQPVELTVNQNPDFMAAVERPGDFLAQRWTNADGTPNYRQQALDVAMIKNGLNLISEAHAKGMELGSRKVTDRIENPEALTSTAVPTTEPDRSALIAAIKQQTRQPMGATVDY